MRGCAKEPHVGVLGMCVGPERGEVRIPHAEAEEQSLILEELLSHVGSHSSTMRVIDLSEYVDGVTLAFAGMLASFREAARLRGCEVQYTGLMKGCVSCLAK